MQPQAVFLLSLPLPLQPVPPSQPRVRLPQPRVLALQGLKLSTLDTRRLSLEELVIRPLLLNMQPLGTQQAHSGRTDQAHADHPALGALERTFSDTWIRLACASTDRTVRNTPSRGKSPPARPRPPGGSARARSPPVGTSRARQDPGGSCPHQAVDGLVHLVVLNHHQKPPQSRGYVTECPAYISYIFLTFIERWEKGVRNRVTAPQSQLNRVTASHARPQPNCAELRSAISA